MTQLIITLAVSPDFRDDPDLFYQLARAKHDADDVALVVHGFTYDVGLQLVQVERTDGPPTPVDLLAKAGEDICPRCGGTWGDDITCLYCCDDDGKARPR